MREKRLSNTQEETQKIPKSRQDQREKTFRKKVWLAGSRLYHNKATIATKKKKKAKKRKKMRTESDFGLMSLRLLRRRLPYNERSRGRA